MWNTFLLMWISSIVQLGKLIAASQTEVEVGRCPQGISSPRPWHPTWQASQFGEWLASRSLLHRWREACKRQSSGQLARHQGFPWVGLEGDGGFWRLRASPAGHAPDLRPALVMAGAIRFDSCALAGKRTPVALRHFCAGF